MDPEAVPLLIFCSITLLYSNPPRDFALHPISPPNTASNARLTCFSWPRAGGVKIRPVAFMQRERHYFLYVRTHMSIPGQHAAGIKRRNAL
jgi:hypothetical protein